MKLKNNSIITIIKKYPMLFANLSYAPLIIYYSAIPLHWNAMLPEISKMYYLLAIFILILLLLSTICSLCVLFCYTQFKILYKYLIFGSLLLGYWTSSQAIVNYRLKYHLQKYGMHTEAKIISTVEKQNFVRHKVVLKVNNFIYYGYIDYEHNLNVDGELSYIQVTVSTIDPRIYQDELE